jgi:hypothetical protein
MQAITSVRSHFNGPLGRPLHPISGGTEVRSQAASRLELIKATIVFIYTHSTEHKVRTGEARGGTAVTEVESAVIDLATKAEENNQSESRSTRLSIGSIAGPIK